MNSTLPTNISEIGSLFGSASKQQATQGSLVALIVANLVPLVMALFFGWSLINVVIFYWWENVVVGFWTIGRMGIAGSKFLGSEPISDQGRSDRDLPSFDVGPTGRQASLLLIPFFIMHYFFFCFVHGVILIGLFAAFSSGTDQVVGWDPFGAPNWPGPLFIFPLVGDFAGYMFDLLSTGGLISLGALMLSHGISFFQNYLGQGEYRRTLAILEMFRPYGRVFVLHMGIILGGALVMLLGSPVFLVLLLVLMKTAGDAGLHLMFHRGTLFTTTATGD